MERLEGTDSNYIDYKLPSAGLFYYENLLSKELADFYFETFQLMPFTQGRVRTGLERRLSCYYSELRNPDGTLREYYYAGKFNKANEFTDELTELKKTIEAITGEKYNSCLVNLYQHGKQVIGWHQDKEISLVPESAIASVSLGAERWFDVLANKNAPDPEREISIRMKHGSMILMKDQMQKYYLHQVRQEAAVKDPRINLTFRLSK